MHAPFAFLHPCGNSNHLPYIKISQIFRSHASSCPYKGKQRPAISTVLFRMSSSSKAYVNNMYHLCCVFTAQPSVHRLALTLVLFLVTCHSHLVVKQRYHYSFRAQAPSFTHRLESYSLSKLLCSNRLCMQIEYFTLLQLCRLKFVKCCSTLFCPAP